MKPMRKSSVETMWFFIYISFSTLFFPPSILPPCPTKEVRYYCTMYLFYLFMCVVHTYMHVVHRTITIQTFLIKKEKNRLCYLISYIHISWFILNWKVVQVLGYTCILLYEQNAMWEIDKYKNGCTCFVKLLWISGKNKN